MSRRINNPERYISRKEAADCLRQIAASVESGSSDELCWCHVSVYIATTEDVDDNLARIARQQERSKTGKARL